MFKTFINNLRRQAEENPLGALVILTFVASTLVKVINAGVQSRNSRTWAKEVDRRRNMSRY